MSNLVTTFSRHPVNTERLIVMPMWKTAIYLFVGILAISVGPLMWFQMDAGEVVDSKAILAEHKTMGQTHRELTEGVSELNQSMTRLNAELELTRQKIDVVERQLRLIEGTRGLSYRKGHARRQ